jgi:hypothetical protein
MKYGFVFTNLAGPDPIQLTSNLLNLASARPHDQAVSLTLSTNLFLENSGAAGLTLSATIRTTT